MGLTIHYSLKARGGDARARKLVHTLHQTAQDLPLKELGPVIELVGPDCDWEQRKQDDPLRWLLIQARESVETAQRQVGGTVYSTGHRVTPSRLIAFTTLPGDGCEEANFGLGQFPTVVETRDGPLKTGLTGWRWSSFCKTQYASDPRYGGAANFLRCHLTVIALLDKAKNLGCLDEVDDEGKFWQQRDIVALVNEIGSWNELIAAFGGRLKDIAGEAVEMPISQFPTFEQLEAAGQDRLPPEIAVLTRLLDRVAKEHAAAP